MQANNMKAAIYCRVATKDDFAIEKQRDSLRHFAQSKGYADCTEYIDNGVSGVTLDRPAFSRLNADMQAGIVKAVFVNNLSRIGRSTFQVMQWLEVAESLGIEIITEHDEAQNGIGILRSVFSSIAQAV